MAAAISPTTQGPVTPQDIDVNSLPLVSLGISGAILQVSDTIVIKKPIPLPNSKEHIAVECEIYRRLGPHPHITKFLGVYQGMPLLERLQCPLRKRLGDLRDQHMAPAAQDVLRWATQMCDGLAHAHSRRVFQVDISLENVLLDWCDNAKLSDFAGSSIDGCPALVLPSQHSEHPRWPAANPTMRSELFALGSALYEIETTNKPYHDETDSQVFDLFEQDIFPDTKELLLGRAIEKCWLGRYQDVGEVLADIQEVQEHTGKGSTKND